MRARRVAILIQPVLLFWVTLVARAGPPLIADDPYTIGPGNTELILASSVQSRPGRSVLSAPIFDFTFGLVERLDLTLVGAAAFGQFEEFPRTSGNVALGFKWQPVALPHWNVSFTPDVGLRSIGKQRVGFTLPVQIEYMVGEYALGTDFGWRVGVNSRESWLANGYAAWLRPPFTALAEVWSTGVLSPDASDLGIQVGGSWRHGDLELIAAVGTGIASWHAERLDVTAYVGVRWYTRWRR